MQSTEKTLVNLKKMIKFDLIDFSNSLKMKFYKALN